MICYRDMTFCSANVAFADFSQGCPEFQPIVTDASDDDDQLVGIMP